MQRPDALLARARGLVLPIQVFVGGASVMALELLGSRLLAPRFGSTLYVWGSLIGVVMAALALGAYVGGRRADRAPTADAFSRVLLLAGLAASLLPLISPWALDLVSAAGFGIVWGPLVATLILLGPPTVLLGMATPFAIRLTATGVASAGTISGNVYALSTAGSIAGTFATAFVLVPGFRLPSLFTLVGGVLLVAALLGLRERVRSGVAVGVVLLLASPAGLAYVERAAVWAQTDLANRVVYETETPYHQIKVIEGRDDGSEDHLRKLVMDGLTHSTMYTKRPNETSTDYVYHFHLARAFLDEEPESVLFIGAGGFSGPKKFLEAYPNASVDVVEIDPEVVRVAEEWFDAPVDDPRVRVFTEDGRRYLAHADRDYDVVVLDAYSRTYIPFHLMTAEFFFELADVLTPRGVVVSNVIAGLSGAASDILKAEVKTMDQAFAETYVFPVRGGSYPFAQNVIVVATPERERSTEGAVVARARDASTSSVPGLDAYAAKLVALDTFGAPVFRDDFSAIEIMLNPVTRLPYEGE